VVYFSISLTLAAVVYVALSYAQDISTYPLTLTWSETGRYYYASLFFAKRIYGVDTPPTVLHPSRYLLQAIPFIIADTPLWLHRAWQALLWVTLPALTAWLLAKRMALSNPFHQWMLAGAAFLYLMIGPVYYHLLVPIILMLWGFSTPMKFAAGSNWIRSLILLFMASAWAGISRVNWYPVPGLLAATLIFLEEPIQHTDASDRPFFGLNAAVWRYLLKAALLTVLGAGTALLAQIAYISWSGNQAEQFTTSFTSDLLWSRLLPNPTFAPGILLGIVLVSLPAALIVVGKLLQPFHGAPMLRRVHPLRLLGLMGILLVLLIGGLVVSVKIGASVGSCATQRPAYSATMSSTMPMAVVSSTRPGRMNWRYTPISIAMGMVRPMVTVPHGLCCSAFTTTSASTEMRMIMMPSTATSAVAPATGPISSRAMRPSDLPSRRTEAARITKSCTAPPSTTPTMIQRAPGR